MHCSKSRFSANIIESRVIARIVILVVYGGGGLWHMLEQSQTNYEELMAN